VFSHIFFIFFKYKPYTSTQNSNINIPLPINKYMTRLSISGIFNLLEKLNMKFPDGRSGLDDKVRFEEKVSFKLTKIDGKTITGG